MKVGIIGLGSIGCRHGQLVRAAGHEVVGYDPNPGARSRFEAFGVPVLNRVDAIEGVDAVIVASPSVCHLEDMEAAIAAGRPVLVEKPFGHDLERARIAVEMAQKKNVQVFAAYNLRHRKVVKVVREWLLGGIIGKPLVASFVYGSYLPDWRPDSDYRVGYAADLTTGGVIFDVIHEFDLALHMLGPAELGASVCNRSGLLEIASEDRAVIVLNHASGSLSTLRLDYLRRPARRSLEIVGSDGVLRADLRSGIAEAVGPNGEECRGYREAVVRDDEYISQIRAFLNAEKDNPSICLGASALESLRLAIEARAALS